MSTGRNRLAIANFAFMFVLLLAIHLPSAYAGGVAHTMTAYGNAQITTAQSKFGGASGLFDGTGDYLSTPDSDDWYFGTGDFTIDFWVRFNALGTQVQLYDQYVDANNEIALFHKVAEQQLTFLSYTSSTYQLRFYASWNPSTNTWYHIALVRNGNTWYLFMNGVSQPLTLVAGAYANSISNIAGSVKIGYDGTSAVTYLNGWLDEYRVSKGVARWITGFTPPTSAYTADGPTVLLLHMDGTDASTTFTDDSVPPSGPDFSISSSPSSQSVGAGVTASFTLNLAASGGFSGTVSLSVTSGSPPGITPTITPDSISSFPGTAMLSVPTLITTSGTFSIVVTATCTSPSITHTVTATLTVTGPASYSFNVKATATQVVVTLTYSWSGSGAPPSGSIAIAGPDGTPTLQESAGVIYDRTSITVSGTTSTYSIIHRVTFTITAPGSAQTWTALISLAGVTNYSIAIEVS